MRFNFEYQASENISFVSRLRPRRKFIVNEGDDREKASEEIELRLEQAYISFTDMDGDLDIWFGRSRHRDEREWIYDEFLDGLRVFYNKSKFDLEFSVTRETVITLDLLTKDKEDKQSNYF